MLYTFDEAKCLARSPISQDVRVITGENCSSFGIIDIYTCLRSVVNSSPEIISNLKFLDYAVYTTDYTEPGLPLVGHGMFSWLNLEMETDKTSEDNQRFVVGRVCKSILTLYSGGAGEILEITLRLKPISSFSQAQYLSSIKLYKSLASFLPVDFNHPEWAAFLSKNPKLSSFVQTCDTFKRPRVPDLNDDDSTQKKQKSSSSLSIEMMGNQSNGNSYSLLSPPQSSTPQTSQVNLEPTISYSSSFDVAQTATKSHSYNARRKADWNDTPTSRNIMSSPGENEYDRQKLDEALEKNNLVVDAKRSISIDEGVKVVAKGNKYKARTNNEKDGFLALKGGSLRCDNCSRVDNTWRRFKFSASASTPEKEYTFCNPCGLWYSTKKTLRPSHLWIKDGNAISPPKDKETTAPSATTKHRVIKGSKRRSNDPYVGPSIAALLAQNARTKPSYSSSPPTSISVDTETPINTPSEVAKAAIEQTTPSIATPSSASCTPTDPVLGKSTEAEKKTTPKSTSSRETKLISKEVKKTFDETIKKPRKRTLSKAITPHTPITKTSKIYKLVNIAPATENKENMPPGGVKMAVNNITDEKKQNLTETSFDIFGDLSGSPSRWINKFLEDHKRIVGDEEMMKIMSDDNLASHEEILDEDFSSIINTVKCPEISLSNNDFMKPKVTLSSSPPGQIYVSEDDSDSPDQLEIWVGDADPTLS